MIFFCKAASFVIMVFGGIAFGMSITSETEKKLKYSEDIIKDTERLIVEITSSRKNIKDAVTSVSLTGGDFYTAVNGQMKSRAVEKAVTEAVNDSPLTEKQKLLIKECFKNTGSEAVEEDRRNMQAFIDNFEYETSVIRDKYRNESKIYKTVGAAAAAVAALMIL